MKKFFSIVLCTVMIAGFPVASFANEEVNYGHSLYIRDEISVPLSVENENLFLNATESANLPRKYDSRDKGYVSPVKDQGDYGTCWTFATMSVLESYMLKYYGEKNEEGKVIDSNKFDFSEDHLLHMSINGCNNPNGYSWGIEKGGNTFMSYTYFMNDLGIVTEKNAPYNPEIKKDYSASKDLPKVNYRVDSVAFIPQYWYLGVDDTKQRYINQMKNLIYDYGSVTCGMLYSSAYIGSDGISSYYNQQTRKTNHMVAIIGWDDDYPKENFKTQPACDGAFIAKNSWGEDDINGGIFYISYCDYNLFADVMAVTSVVPRNDGEILYNKDPYAALTIVSNYRDTLNPKSFGNAFIRKTKNEMLTAVSIYAIEELNSTNLGYQYDLYYIDDVPKMQEDGTMFLENYESRRKLIYSDFDPTYTGYYTLRLKEPIEIKNEKFSIIAEVNSSYEVFMMVENPITGFSDNARAEAGESFHNDAGYDDGVFESQIIINDVGYNLNFCIKAITETSEPYAEFELANFTDENGTIKTKSTLNEGETVYAVPAMNYTNIDDKQIICVGYKNNQMKMMSFKNIDSQNRFKFENIPSDFKDYTFYMYVWGLNGLKPVGQGISVGN